MSSTAQDLEFRGLVFQASDKALLKELDSGQMSCYVGFDPTSDSLHLGNLLQLCNLRRLQAGGHRPIALLGGGTGLIGDPGGKSEERALLDRDQLARNIAGIRPQLERFLDFSPTASSTRAVLVDNSDWLDEAPLIDFLRDVGKHFTVGQMIAKESVKSRIDRPEQGISFTEFSYMLLQAYDYLQLFDRYGCTLQMGGSDQWGNITMGIDLIRKQRQAVAYALTSPLVTKPDGTKFGKSEKGAIFLDPVRTSPFAMYQYLVRSEDSVVGAYLRYFTFLSHDEILALDQSRANNPAKRESQRALARDVCTFVHGDTETARVERATAALYSEDVRLLDADTLVMACADSPSSTIARTGLDGNGFELVEALVMSGLVTSKGAARTAITQGGVYVNNVRVNQVDAKLGPSDVLAGRFILLRRGRREMHLLMVG